MGHTREREKVSEVRAGGLELDRLPRPAPSGDMSHPGFDAVLVPWLTGCGEEGDCGHGSSAEVLR
jgi:hypothetical protein